MPRLKDNNWEPSVCYQMHLWYSECSHCFTTYTEHSASAHSPSLLTVFIWAILIPFHYILISPCPLSPPCQIRSKGSFCFMIPAGKCHSWLNTSSAHKVLIVEVLKAPAIHHGLWCGYHSYQNPMHPCSDGISSVRLRAGGLGEWRKGGRERENINRRRSAKKIIPIQLSN